MAIEEIKLDGDPNEESIKLRLNDYLVLPEDDIAEPVPIVSILQNGYEIPIFTEDNISMLFGPAKARKSALVRAICQAVLIGHNNKMVSNYHRKGIGIIDTEQSRFHCHRATKNIFYLTNGLNVDYYSVSTLNIQQKKKLVELYLEDNPNTGLLIIDNIVHFVLDFNSATEAAEITQWLLKIKNVYKTHILVILHENPGSNGFTLGNKPRGHLGTNLMNLCETGLRIVKDQEHGYRSIVSAALTRGRDFDEFELTMDDQMIPYLEDIDEEETNNRNTKSYS